METPNSTINSKQTHSEQVWFKRKNGGAPNLGGLAMPD